MASAIDPKNYPVLFVDDEEMALISLADRFDEEFTIHTAKSGKEALDILERNREIAVIVSDQRMPGMSGIEFLAQAKQIAPSAIRMLFTAYTEMETVIEAINKGNIYRYISKPYDSTDLRCTLLQGIEYHALLKERDRLYAERIETLKRVAQANRLTAIGTLAAGMAHEINNPLVAVSTFLQMLPEKLKEPQPDKDYLENFYGLALKETERIRSLIRKLLEYSKGSTQEALVLKETDLNALVLEVTGFLKHEATKKGNRFEPQLKEGLPHAKADQEKVRQVIMNLLLNALHATENGKITIATSLGKNGRGQEYLLLEITDTGAGISEDDLEKLFNPFFTTKGPSGTGLGLMICRHIVDRHRGTIDLQSKPGEGTRITIQLPLDPTTYERRKTEKRMTPAKIASLGPPN